MKKLNWIKKGSIYTITNLDFQYFTLVKGKGAFVLFMYVNFKDATPYQYQGIINTKKVKEAKMQVENMLFAMHKELSE